MTLPPALLAKLVCPVTRAPLRPSEDGMALVSDAARLAFPVRKGVPVLVMREARPVD